MAVARPSIYRARTPVAATSPIGEGLGAIAGALERRATRQEQQRSSEHRRKTDLLMLQARNGFYEQWDAAMASGALSEATVEQRLRFGEELLDELSAPLRRHDTAAAEELELKTRQTLSTYTAGARAQEEKDAQAAMLATYTEAELRFKRDVPTLMREAMVARTPEAAQAAWAEVQNLHGDMERMHRNLPEGQKEHQAAELQSFMDVARFDGAVNHAVETGTVHAFFGRVANRTDVVAEQEGVRFSDGISGDHVMKMRRQAYAEARTRAQARAAEAEAAKVAGDAEAQGLYMGLQMEVRNGLVNVRDASDRLALAGHGAQADKLEAWWVERNDRMGKMSQDELDADPSVVEHAAVARYQVGLASDRTEVSAMVSRAIEAEARGELSEDQLGTIEAVAESRGEYLRMVEEDLNEDQKAMARQIDLAWRAEFAMVGVIGDAAVTTLKSPEQAAFYYEMRTVLDPWLKEQMADPSLIRLVVNDWVPAVWEAQRSTNVVVSLGGRRGSGQFSRTNNPATEGGTGSARALLYVERLTTAMARKADFKDEKTALEVLMDPELQVHMRYDEAGSVDAASTILELEKTYGPDSAPVMYEDSVKPILRVTRGMRGVRNGVELVDDMSKMVGHLER